MRRSRAKLWLVDPDGRFADPTHRAAEILRFEPERLCSALASALERRADVAADPERAAWRTRFAAAERRTRAALAAGLAADERLLGPRAVAELCDALPPRATLFVSNSLPVRALDAVLPPSIRPLHVLANRGASGIDGIVSSALGAAATGAAPLVLLTGDLAFLHDLGGFVAAVRQRISATIVVVNNDGGGIFSQLPVAAHREAVGFDPLFTTPHGLELAHAARLFGASFARVGSWEELRLALKHALGAAGLSIVEIPVDRELDTEARRRLFANAARAGEAGP